MSLRHLSRPLSASAPARSPSPSRGRPFTPVASSRPASAGAAAAPRHDFARIAVFAADPGVQRVADRPGADPGSPREVREAARRAAGTAWEPFPHAARIQRSFGRHALGPVRAHLGPAARAGADAIGAAAFATGEHVVFSRAPDLRTAAHEAAHVVQQRAGVRLPHGVGGVDDGYERHADAVAARVAAGHSAEALLDGAAAEAMPAPPAAGTAVQGIWVTRAGVRMNVARRRDGDEPIDPAQLTEEERREEATITLQARIRGQLSRRRIHVQSRQVAPGLMHTTIGGDDFSRIGIPNVNARADGGAGRVRQQMTVVSMDARQYRGEVIGNQGLTNPVRDSAALAGMVDRAGPSPGALINGGFFSTNGYYTPHLDANTPLGPTRTISHSGGAAYDNLSSLTEEGHNHDFESPQAPGFLAPLTLGPNLPTNYRHDSALLSFDRSGKASLASGPTMMGEDADAREERTHAESAVTAGPLLSEDGRATFGEDRLQDPAYQYATLRGQRPGGGDIPCPPGALYHASDRNPRSAIIVPGDTDREDARTQLLYVHGRRPDGRAAGMTLPELARTTARLGTGQGDQGLNLDGGGSSVVGTRGAGDPGFDFDAQVADGRDSSTMIAFRRRDVGPLPNPWEGPVRPDRRMVALGRDVAAERRRMAQQGGTCRDEVRRDHRDDEDPALGV